MQNLPTRKSPRLTGYDYSRDGIYFLTICTEDRKPLLSQIVGADAHIGPQVKLTPIGRTVEHYLLRIPGLAAYVIMPNHIHLLLRLDSGSMRESSPTSVSSAARSFKTLATKAVGHSIWQSGFYDHIIRDEQDYDRHLQYIAENPAKWAQDEYYSQGKWPG